MSYPLDNEVHELKLGSTFDPVSSTKNGFHTVRYDFKPASVDTEKEACVEVGSRNQVTITVPHVDGTSRTVFKGNKQPLTKECVLIIDHETGTYTLEKVSSKITVKKTRLDGSSKAMQHIASVTGRVTPVDRKSAASSQSKAKPSQKNSPESDGLSITPLHSDASKGNDDNMSLIGEISDSSDEDEPAQPTPSTSHKKNLAQASSSSQMRSFDVLNNDLALSESGSDSD